LSVLQERIPKVNKAKFLALVNEYQNISPED